MIALRSYFPSEEQLDQIDHQDNVKYWGVDPGLLRCGAINILVKENVARAIKEAKEIEDLKQPLFALLEMMEK